jgi:transposase-like protein
MVALTVERPSVSAALHGRTGVDCAVILTASPDPRLRLAIELHGLTDGAIRYAESIRWPGGVLCPRCSSNRVGWMESRRRYSCRDCGGYQFRVTVGTVLHYSHLPVSTWLMATQLMLAEPNGLPANQLWALIGGSYRTAWFVEHRIRTAIEQVLGTADFNTENLTRRESVRYASLYNNERRWRAETPWNASGFRSTVAALLAADPLTERRLKLSPEKKGRAQPNAN